MTRCRRLLSALLLAIGALSAHASTNGVVISQIYGGGGNSGATIRNDFIELFNGGSAAVSLAGWSVQYASATGTTWAVTNLSAVTLAPGQRYLVQEAVGAGGTVDLPAPDATGTIAMSATAGKVALVSSTVALSGSAPSSASLIDLVGFGPTANGFEGAPTAAPSNTTAVLRANGGCSDTNNNASDFATGVPSPRNSAAPATPCSTQNAQPIVPSCPAAAVAAGAAATVLASATDADSIVNAVSATGSLPAGFSLGTFTPAAAIGGTAIQAIGIAASVAPGSYALALQWSNDGGQTAGCTQTIAVSGITPIYSIQGNGASSPLLGQSVTTRGVVTLVTNNGFFVQDPVGDGDASTSDGIFVFTSSAPTVSAGQYIQLNATVAEFNVGAASNPQTSTHTMTELTGPSAISVLGTGLAITPVVLSLPVASLDVLEQHEGMLVTVQGPLTVSQNFFLGRFGELTISAGGRLETPTNRLRPGAAAAALADLNERSSLLLGDGTSLQNPNPTPFLDAANTRRAGDTIASLTGVLDYALATASNAGLASYRLQPTQAPVFASGNPRSTAPEAVGGALRVAAANVLNFFTTFTDGTTAAGQTGQGCTLGASVSADNCRGADSLAEFTRQRSKIVEALAALDADVIGLMELQNNATAIQNLVDALNAKLGAGTWQRVADPSSGTGTDAIKVGMIYRPARVTPIGASLSDPAPIHNRPPLAQGFALPNGERFALVVNHFKSKGCDGAAGADLDQGDGQGCFNDRRRQQAAALLGFVGSVQAAAGTSDVLLVGDFNAYAKEDPIDDLVAGGLVDQIARFNAFGYSYVFDGAAGRLDHALATASLSGKVRGATEWHINADEPSVIDYNLEFKQPACATCGADLYTPTPYRASDHDPVLVGLELQKAIVGTAGRDTLVGTPGDDRIEGGEGADTLSGNGGRNVFVYRNLRDAGDTITDFVPGTDRLDLAALLASIGANPATALADGIVRIVAAAAGAQVLIDSDGSAGPASARLLVTLRGVAAAAIVPARDLILQ